MLVLGFIIIALYILPGWIASARQHHQAVPIWLVNLFLGWTFLGWVVALVWACSAKRPEDMMVKVVESTRPAPVIVAQATAADDIERFARMHAAGVLTDEEFTAKKRQLLGLATPTSKLDPASAGGNGRPY